MHAAAVVGAGVTLDRAAPEVQRGAVAVVGQVYAAAPALGGRVVADSAAADRQGALVVDATA